MFKPGAILRSDHRRLHQTDLGRPESEPIDGRGVRPKRQMELAGARR